MMDPPPILYNLQQTVWVWAGIGEARQAEWCKYFQYFISFNSRTFCSDFFCVGFSGSVVEGLHFAHTLKTRTFYEARNH